MKIENAFLLLAGSFLFVLSCSNDSVIEKSRHEIRYSECLSDSLYLKWNHNQIGISLMEDYKIWSGFLSEHHIDFWGEHGEEYNKPMLDGLNAFSDKLLAEPLSTSSKVSKTYYSYLFYTSHISGPVSISSEQSLFGEKPGEDISYNFRMVSTRCMILNEDYKVKYAEQTEKPKELKDYFFHGHVLMSNGDSSWNEQLKYMTYTTPYIIEMKTRPTESCASTILTVRIPVKEDLYLDAFDMSGNLEESKVAHRERVLKGSVDLRFD